MITASHNPPNFNGYKIKSHLGAPADAELCGKIESFLNRNPARQPTRSQLRNVQLKDLKPAHYAALKKLVDWNLVSTSGLRFAHEALFGVGAGCFEQLLRGTSCKVTTLDARHDVLFGGINPEPIEKNYIHSSAYLRRHPHDFCLVTDGDADRIGGMDGRGRYVSTHQLICLLLHHFAVNRQGRGRVVKALTTTSMVDKMCAELGLHLTETGVGFKYMASEMIKGGVLLAAEESGGIGFQGHIPERDGIAAGVVILEMLAWERASINELIARLIRKYGAHEYGRIDASYPVEERANLMRRLASNAPAKLGRSRVIDVKTSDGVKFIAEDTSWLMLRGSGTEPIVRIYAESSSEQAVRRLLSLGVRLMKTV
jgi:phosphomannomutase